MSEFQDIEKLIRLKRYEQPPEGYYGQFLEEFHQRQRSAVLRQNASDRLFERAAGWFTDFGNSHWLYAAAGAYLVVMTTALLRLSPDAPGQQPVADSHTSPQYEVASPAPVFQPVGNTTGTTVGEKPSSDESVQPVKLLREF